MFPGPHLVSLSAPNCFAYRLLTKKSIVDKGGMKEVCSTTKQLPKNDFKCCTEFLSFRNCGQQK